MPQNRSLRTRRCAAVLKTKSAQHKRSATQPSKGDRLARGAAWKKGWSVATPFRRVYARNLFGISRIIRAGGAAVAILSGGAAAAIYTRPYELRAKVGKRYSEGR